MKRLLLLGGGHTHVDVICRFAIAPPRHTYRIRIVLVSPGRHTPIPDSRMLPEIIPGHYESHDCHTLALISAGERYAVALQGHVAFEGK